MLYNQPYGISDPDASYINGNPSTGTMGSIPPAASIEHPQREIVNFMSKSGLTPSASDLLQLAKAVQAGLVNYGTDGGGVNDIQITPVVPISGYALGQRFVIKIAYGNTSQVTVNISSIGKAPLIHTDLTPMNAYELLAGQLIEIAYDGANWQAIGGVSGGAVMMTAPHHLYVSDSIGSDTLYDGTSAVISGTMTGPFKTVQKALATMKKYNLGGWVFYIHVADGVYTSTAIIEFPLPNGSGQVQLLGNVSNPAAASIFNVGTGTAWHFGSGGSYYVEGFSYRTTATEPTSGDAGNGLAVAGNTVLGIGKTLFNQCNGANIISGPSSSCYISGDITIAGPCQCHQAAYMAGIIANAIPYPTYSKSLTISAPITVSDAFCTATGGGGALRPVWKTISGASNVTGPKYRAVSNGTIDTLGSGASYLPGTIAGTVASGGQYT